MNSFEQQITALFVGKDPLCDPDIEQCETETEQLTGYESYERSTLMIGLIVLFLAYLPGVFFLYPIWYGITEKMRT